LGYSEQAMAKLRTLGVWLLLGLSSSACGTTEEDGSGAGGSGTGGNADGSGTGGDATDSLGSGGSDGASGSAPGIGGTAPATGGSTPGSGGAMPETGGQSSGGAPGTGGGVGSGGAPSDAVPTSGCDMDVLPVGGLRSIVFLGSSGESEREFILTLPENYDPDHPYRLIFGFHGGQYDAEWVANGEEPLTGPYFGLQEEANDSAVFVAPQALPGSWSNTDERDLEFVESMLNTIQGEVCIDASRIFSVGFSMGGIMTVRLGCALGNVFRAIAPMSPNMPSDCHDVAEPIAYWTSHGADDMSITPEQGQVALAEFLERNGCSQTTTEAAPEGCVSYEGCSEGNPVNYCTFAGAHVPAPFAGTAIWSFFEQF